MSDTRTLLAVPPGLPLRGPDRAAHRRVPGLLASPEIHPGRVRQPGQGHGHVRGVGHQADGVPHAISGEPGEKDFAPKIALQERHSFLRSFYLRL